MPAPTLFRYNIGLKKNVKNLIFYTSSGIVKYLDSNFVMQYFYVFSYILANLKKESKKHRGKKVFYRLKGTAWSPWIVLVSRILKFQY
jgi:hypothetical protein